jgi:CO/xanthine dehydrogenase Mo-binding subunit
MTTFTDPNPARVPGGIGASITRVDGPLKVTGAARYASDMDVPNPAYAYLHTSAIALGRITDIDDRAARALPGLIEIMTWKNSAGQFKAIKIFSSGGLGSSSIAPLQSPEIRHDGEIVAVIIAETFEIARAASHQLLLTYEARAPAAVFGATGVSSEDATAADPKFKNAKVGDAETAFAKAPVKIDQHYSTPAQHHNAIELILGAFAAGTIVNPVTARSQLMGGMIWGVSSALHEATDIDPRHGRYTNDNLAEYLIPVNADVPSVEVLFVAERDTDVNPLGIKGVGELGGVGTNAAVCNAIYHATGVRIRKLPVRIEHLLGAPT